MTTKFDKAAIDADREHEIAKVRAEILRRAEEEGVKPFTSVEDFAGDPEMTSDFDVEEFLRQVREDRDRLSTRSGE
jgi:hypothetical protein